MKIAFITYTFPPQIGGMQKWNHQMAEAYGKAGHQVDVFHLIRGPVPHQSDYYKYIPIAIDKSTDISTCPPQRYSFGLFFHTLKFVFVNFVRLASYDAWQITVGEAQLLRVLLSLISFFLPVKLISAAGGVVFRARYNLFEKIIKYPVSKMVLRRSDLILVDGIDIKNEMVVHGIVPEKIIICYAGVDIGLFKRSHIPGKLEEYAVARKLPFIPHKRTVLCCCRFSYENAPDVFLEAVDGLSDVQAIMVGNGDMIDALEERAKTVSIPVHFWRTVPYEDLPDIFSNVDVCLYTYSKYIGGISQVIPLSMASGAVVITTDIGDNKALVRDQENGFLVKEGDFETMRLRVQQILDGKQIKTEQIREAARTTIVNDWSIDRRDKEYAELLCRFENQ